MAQPANQGNLNDGNVDAAVDHRGKKDPLERMLDMKDEQIRELRNDLAKKEKQMTDRDKETRDELSKRDKELRDTLAKKDQDWMEKVEDLRGELGKRDTEVHIRKKR